MKKSDFSRHRLSDGGLILVQPLQTRTQNDRWMFNFHILALKHPLAIVCDIIPEDEQNCVP